MDPKNADKINRYLRNQREKLAATYQNIEILKKLDKDFPEIFPHDISGSVEELDKSIKDILQLIQQSTDPDLRKRVEEMIECHARIHLQTSISSLYQKTIKECFPE